VGGSASIGGPEVSELELELGCSTVNWLLDADPSIRSKQDTDGRLPLEQRATYAVGGLWSFEGEVHFPIDGGPGDPSRWNTLRALRVVRWWEKG
jgi:hypothetical protein